MLLIKMYETYFQRRRYYRGLDDLRCVCLYEEYSVYFCLLFSPVSWEMENWRHKKCIFIVSSRDVNGGFLVCAEWLLFFRRPTSTQNITGSSAKKIERRNSRNTKQTIALIQMCEGFSRAIIM